MNLFEEAIEGIRLETGWAVSPSAKAGGVRFELDGGPDFDVFAPDGRRLFLQAALLKPAAGESPEDLAETLARQAAGAALARASTLSFDGQAFNLHQALDLETAGPEAILAAVRSFLNDCDWWQGSLAPAPPGPQPWLRP